MAHLIDKDALVAEIKERIKTYNKGYANDDDSRADALEVLLHDIDTLEVKEVDLEEETEHVKGDYEQADVAWNKDNNMKYIDTEKLKAEIESIGLIPQISADYNDGRNDMKIMFLDTIDSLQQEQPETSKGKFMFPKFLYARTKDNKTIDVSYAPQSLDAMEYIRSDSLQQEQPEVDLEKELNDYGYHYDYVSLADRKELVDFAKHFFELGIKVQKDK